MKAKTAARKRARELKKSRRGIDKFETGLNLKQTVDVKRGKNKWLYDGGTKYVQVIDLFTGKPVDKINYFHHRCGCYWFKYGFSQSYPNQYNNVFIVVI